MSKFLLYIHTLNSNIKKMKTASLNKADKYHANKGN